MAGFHVEAVAGVRVQEGRTLLDLNFRVEWTESRYDDVARCQWGARDHISRL